MVARTCRVGEVKRSLQPRTKLGQVDLSWFGHGNFPPRVLPVQFKRAAIRIITGRE